MAGKSKSVEFISEGTQAPGQWAGLYIRVSTDAQVEEGYSVEAQIDILQAYCKTKGIKRHELYVDGGFSGSNINRPEMQRLIDDVKNRRLSHVIVYKLDRLSRSQKDTLYLIEDVFNPHGVFFMSVKETLDTSSPVGRLMIGILSAFAQLERENIRERTRMGMLERVKKGYWMGGGRVPFGYDYDQEQGILVPNQDAVTVKRIYSLYLEGYPLAQIAQIVGLKYERLAMQILNRRTNCGYINYNGLEYKGRHEAVVDEETYERAMEMQRDRSVKSLRASSGYMLTGLLHCGHCGAKMRYQKWGKRGQKLVCYSQDKHKPHLIKNPDCPQDKLWADEVEGEVISALFHFRINFDGNTAEAAKITALELLNRQYDITAAKIKRLYNQFGDNGDEFLLETIASFKRDLKQITNQIKMEEERNMLSDKMERLNKTLENLQDTWSVMTPHEQQAVARELIKKVTIRDDNIKIEFQF